MKKHDFIAAICFLTTGYLSAQAPSFNQPTGSPLAVGTPTLRGVSSVDLNADGKKDLVVGTAYSNALHIYLGSGNGQFSPAPGSPIMVGNGTIANAVADFNGDLIPDIVVANYNGGYISVLLGTGTGSFTPASTPSITTGSLPYSIDIADFNNDGKKDFVTVSAGANKAYVFLGAGNGTFTQTSGSPVTTGTMPYHVCTGFFNTDSYPDFAVANYTSSSVNVFLGNGSGSFSAAPGSPYSSGTQPRTVVAKDLNSDGRPDLVVGNSGSNNITILLGQANGSFTTAPGSPIGVGSYAFQAAINDYNGDNKQDIAVSNALSNNVSILWGDGSGNFTPATATIPVASNPQNMITDDLDNDGKADLVIAHFALDKVTILINTSTAGVHELTNTNQVHIQPIPAHDQITVKINDFKDEMQFILYDAMGKKIREEILRTPETTFNFESIAKGVYSFTVIHKDAVVQSGHVAFE